MCYGYKNENCKLNPDKFVHLEEEKKNCFMRCYGPFSLCGLNFILFKH